MANIPPEQMMFHEDCLEEEVMGLKYKLEAVPIKAVNIKVWKPNTIMRCFQKLYI